MIRDMTVDDITECVELVRTNWDDKVAERFLHEAHTIFGMKPVHPYAYRWPPLYYVYQNEDGVIVGMAGMMWSWAMKGVIDFIWINVHPDYRSMGIGEKLTLHRINVAKQGDARLINMMTVRPTFFERFGFERVRQVDDWTHMSLKLGELTL